MTNSERYLTVRILFPKAGHADDVLSAIGKVANAARRFDGLVEIGAQWVVLIALILLHLSLGEGLS